MLSFKHTSRGFGIYEFKDFNNEDCSLQKSSIVATLSGGDVQAIWLGLNHETIHDGKPIGARMHLSREQVKRLLPILQYFAETGALKEP